jgi:hypothetical protein
MKHLKSINELFGFSAKEKEEKQKKLDIETLKIELQKYNWKRLFAQPGDNAWDSENIKKLINIRLSQAKTELPTFYKLLSNFFEMKTNLPAVTCYMKIGVEKIKGIIPSQFEFLLVQQREILDDENIKQIAINRIVSMIENN